MTLLDDLKVAGVEIGNVAGVPSGMIVGIGYGAYNEYVTIPDNEAGRAFFVAIATKSGVASHRDLMDAVKNGKIIDREEFLTAWQGERYKIVVDGE